MLKIFVKPDINVLYTIFHSFKLSDPEIFVFFVIILYLINIIL